ncbi:hypothetical protein [Anaerosporobacter faecicola]|uniref:hypothetical protein n=1 Tax=Anaerosporobacter faecicola TaxID=2718714 RepID=UPI00143976A8|nr:hypothetical protein [Anaerosporobacter faecicola]
MCYNDKDKVYYYLFDDVIRGGIYEVSWNMRAVSLENKTIKETYLYSKDMTIEEEQESYCYYDGMGNIISEEEYKKLVEQKVSSCDVLNATIHWEKNTAEQWKEMDRIELQDKLATSYENFTIK